PGWRRRRAGPTAASAGNAPASVPRAGIPGGIWPAAWPRSRRARIRSRPAAAGRAPTDGPRAGPRPGPAGPGPAPGRGWPTPMRAHAARGCFHSTCLHLPMRPPEASPTRPAIARPSRGPAGPLGMGENGPSPAAADAMPFPDDRGRLACNRHHAWTSAAIRRIEADFNRSADTHLIPLSLPGFPGIDIYFKDESSHPTGSLKHRLARSLFLYALANGWLHEGSTVVEASSGSTAVSEAYFARLLGLPLAAWAAASTSPEKIAAIEFHGGRCPLVRAPREVAAESARVARASGGHFMDQFTSAERATDWRANNNIAESIFRQMEHEPHPVPAWVVCSAGTGGTSATI